MSVSKKLLLGTNLTSLICTLYTLSEDNRLFKKLNLKNDIFPCINNEDHFYRDEEIFFKFSLLLNDSSLRRFAFKLIKPIFNRTYFPSSSFKNNSNGKNKIYKEEGVLLRKYLRKFKYNYYYYFYNQKLDSGTLSTEKEINLTAIKLLFLIVGI